MATWCHDKIMAKSNLTEDKQLFAKSFLSFKSISSLEKFLDDLLTEQEITDLAQRLKIAKQFEGGKSYLEVSDKVDASTTTITKVGQAIKYGKGSFTKLFSKFHKSK